jgi:O-antigen/teichoic acid export membrane protein
LDKALKMGQVSAVGSFQLFLGKTLSTVVLAVGSIILTILISEGDYGLYVVALIPATTALLFQDWGIGAALIRYCAKYRAANQEGNLRRTIIAGFTFEVATGLILSLFLFFSAGFIASSIFNKPDSVLPITLISITVLSTSVMGASQSIIIGFERMALSSYTMICQAVTQCFLSPLLVFLGYGTLGAVIGYTVGSVVGATISAILFYLIIFRKLKVEDNVNSGIFQILRPMLGYGVPLAIATLLGGLMTQFVSFMVASFADSVMIGNYGIATNFTILLTFFTFPISTVLFPAFSKLDGHREPQLLKTVFSSSIKYTALFIVPATLAIMVLSNQLIGTIYGDKWHYAPLFLTLYVTSQLFVIFGSLSNNSALTGLGATKILMKLNIITLCVGVPLAFLLIPNFGILGAIFVLVVASLPSMFLGLYWTWKNYGLKADFKSSGKIFFSAGVAALVTYLFLAFFSYAAWVMFSIGVILFLAVYLVVASFVGAINQADINNLRGMFSGLGFIAKLLEIPLRLVEELLKVRSFGVMRKHD